MIVDVMGTVQTKRLLTTARTIETTTMDIMRSEVMRSEETKCLWTTVGAMTMLMKMMTTEERKGVLTTAMTIVAAIMMMMTTADSSLWTMVMTRTMIVKEKICGDFCCRHKL